MYPYLIFIGGFNAGKNFHDFSLLLYKKSIHVQQIFQTNWTVFRIHNNFSVSQFSKFVHRRKKIFRKHSRVCIWIRWFHNEIFIFQFLTVAPSFSAHILQWWLWFCLTWTRFGCGCLIQNDGFKKRQSMSLSIIFGNDKIGFGINLSNFFCDFGSFKQDFCQL